MLKAEQWVQIEIEARECPVLTECVDRAKYGHQSREDAIVAAAIELSRMRRELIAERQRTTAALIGLADRPGFPSTLGVT